MNEHNHHWEPASFWVGGEDLPARRCAICGLLRLEAEEPAAADLDPYPVICSACYIGGPLDFGKNCGRRRRHRAEAGAEPACAACGAPTGPRTMLWWHQDRWLCMAHMEEDPTLGPVLGAPGEGGSTLGPVQGAPGEVGP